NILICLPSCHLITNMVILHKDLVDDFEAFCRANSSPLLLLYRSKCGEWSCSPLATGSDIKFFHIRSIVCLRMDIVTFYLGCSFGFEAALMAAGVPVRNVEQGKNVSMYKTSVTCIRAGQFHCPMVDAAAQCTHVIPLAHGGPLLGIHDLSQPDYGDPVEECPGDVPVFWACGVTGVETVQSCSKSPLMAFTHSPGCMFITDQKAETISPLTLEPAHCPLTFCISQNPQLYSMASKKAVQQIRAIEELDVEDPGMKQHTFDPQKTINNKFVRLAPESGIGDGGNELGMGKVKAAVKAYMPNGNLIACDVAADFAITAGVSSWGSYAVACALYVLNLCPIHWRYLQRGLGLSATPDQQSLWTACLPTVAKEEEMLQILVKYGIRSGKTANLGLEVDGLTFHPYHSDIIQRLRNLTLA
uniref:D-glutamate cyclase n=1 Tax=Sinocyclocheilus rhinocerous TaxID=307959 RepID=A0A673N7X9_9TELE